MISHDFVLITEGFRANDDDLIGSKLFNSPRSKGEIVPMKFSSSLDNNRFFPNYPSQPVERSNPQAMTVVTFADPKEKEKEKASAKSMIVAKPNNDEQTKNGERLKSSSEQVVKVKDTEKGNARENGVDHSKENGKVSTNESGIDHKATEKVTANGKENEQEVVSDKGSGDGNGKENGEGTTKDSANEGLESGKEKRQENADEIVRTETEPNYEDTKATAPVEEGKQQQQQPPAPTENGALNHVDQPTASGDSSTSGGQPSSSASHQPSSSASGDQVGSLASGDQPGSATSGSSVSSTSESSTIKPEDLKEKQPSPPVPVQNGIHALPVQHQDPLPQPADLQPAQSQDPLPQPQLPQTQVSEKKAVVRGLSAKALTPNEFVPREREYAHGSKADVAAVPKVVAAPNGHAAHPKAKAETGSKLIRSPPAQAILQPVPLEPFSFAKDLTYKMKPVSSPSALAHSLTERSHMVKNIKASKLMIPDYHVPCLQLVVFVLIHSSFLPNKLNNIRVPPNATVEQVIDASVKKLNDLIEKHRPEDPLLVPSKCQLVLAEEDGRPDTDTPVLQRDAAVHRFGCIYFALCKDPESEGVITADSKTFKVVLPSKEYQVLSYKRSLSLGQVLEKVCSKRQLDASVHYFVYSNGNKDMEINLDTLVSDLETTEVTMKCRISRKHTVKNPLRPPLRSRSKNDVFAPSSDSHDSLAPPVLNPKLHRFIGVPQQFFWSPSYVATYVQYTVIKINKYGKKQERIMGIDRERITNSMPVNKPNKTNRPARLMTEVIRAFIPDRPIPSSPSPRKPFSIEFKDNQIQEYESDRADEIVARINYIVSLDAPTKSSRSLE